MKEQNALTRTPQAELSKQIAELWRNESEQVKKSYEALAEQRKKEHDELYPGEHFVVLEALADGFADAIFQITNSNRESASNEARRQVKARKHGRRV